MEYTIVLNVKNVLEHHIQLNYKVEDLAVTFNRNANGKDFEFKANDSDRWFQKEIKDLEENIKNGMII